MVLVNNYHVFGMKENFLGKMFFNFLMLGWVKSFEKYFADQLIILKIKENDFPSKIKENIFQKHSSKLIFFFYLLI